MMPIAQPFFGQGPIIIIDFLNPQTSVTTPLTSVECMSQFIKLLCAVKHNVNIKISEDLMDSYFFCITSMLKDCSKTTLTTVMEHTYNCAATY